MKKSTFQFAIGLGIKSICFFILSIVVSFLSVWCVRGTFKLSPADLYAQLREENFFFETIHATIGVTIIYLIGLILLKLYDIQLRKRVYVAFGYVVSYSYCAFYFIGKRIVFEYINWPVLRMEMLMIGPVVALGLGIPVGLILWSFDRLERFAFKE